MALADDVNGRNARRVVLRARQECQDVVRALREERMVEAERVADELARIGDLGPFICSVAILEEFALLEEVGSDDNRTG